MATAIIMPKAGMAMETGTIIEWKVSVGDRIETGDDILEIETDKVAMGVEAETSGYLLGIIHDVGDVVPVTQTIGWIGEQGEAVPQADAEPEATVAASPSEPEPAAPQGQASVAAVSGRVKATPAARRRAAEMGIDLASVTPSGPDGDVRLRDVETGTAAPGSAASPLARQEAQRAGVSLDGVAGTGPGGRITRRDVVEQAGGLAASATPAGQLPEDTRQPLVGMRKVIAARMLESHQTMPPVTLNATARVDALMELRAQLNADAQERGRHKFSINDLMLLAAARTVRECPWVRVSLDGEDQVQHEQVNLGMAVALEQGLVVPVIRQADTLSLSQISAAARDLGRRAKERKLDVADLEGGTFTVTNLGMYGITTFTPIINPPQAAILGVGAIRHELERRDDGSIGERAVLDLSLTVDHRLIDGAQGALFVQALVGLLERPAQILV